MSELVTAGDVAPGRVRCLTVSDKGGGRLEHPMAVWAFWGESSVSRKDVLFQVD